LAYKIQTPGNYPEESIQNSEHGRSLKSRKNSVSEMSVLSLQQIKKSKKTYEQTIFLIIQEYGQSPA
jgi:hypothetical protein